MPNSIVKMLLLAILAIGVCSSSRDVNRHLLAGEQYPDLTEEQIVFLKWIDKAGLPDPASFEIFESENSDRTRSLLLDNGCEIVVGRTENQIRKFLPTHWKEYSFVQNTDSRSFRRRTDPLEYARRVYEEAWRTDTIRDAGSSSPQKISPLCLWSWLSWRHDDHQLAAKLLTEAERLYATNPCQEHTLDNALGFAGSPGKILSYSEWIQLRIGNAEFDRLQQHFTDPKWKRPQLLHECAWYLDRFPQSFYRPLIVQFMDELQVMIVEDDLHRQLIQRPFSDLGRSEQIQELIYQLRDQTAIERFQFPVSITFPIETGTPTARLIAYGYDAIPQLIGAIDDTHVTRIATGNNNSYAAIMRVGDCAKQLLTTITLGSVRSDDCCDVDDDSNRLRVASVYQDWYRQLSIKGEEELLTEGTEVGDQSSAFQAARLAKINPTRAVAAIRRAIVWPNNLENYIELMNVLGQIPGELATEALINEVKFARAQPFRVKAAEVLDQRGSQEGLRSMLVEWYGARRPRASDNDEINFQNNEQEIQLMVPEYLLKHGCVEAIDAISYQIKKDPLAKRSFLLLCRKYYYLADPLFEIEPAGDDSKSHQKAQVQCDECRKFRSLAIQQIYADLLTDTEPLPESADFLLWGGTVLNLNSDDDKNTGESVDVGQPLTQDLAALMLRCIDPHHYSFTNSELATNRERVCSNLVDAWNRRLAAASLIPDRARSNLLLPPDERESLLNQLKMPPDEQIDLIDKTGSGLEDFQAAAERLAEKYPQVAIPAIELGIHRAADGYGRTLISLIGTIPGEEATAKLLEMTKQSSNVVERITAADSLLKRGRTEGIQMILQEWHGRRLSRLTDADCNCDLEYNNYPLRAYLVLCGQANAIKELCDNLWKQSQHQRLSILHQFNLKSDEERYSIGLERIEDPLSRYARLDTDEWKHLVDHLLFELLNDHSEILAFSGTNALIWNSKDERGKLVRSSFVNLQVCDVAALALRNLDHKRFWFTDDELEDNPDLVLMKLKSADSWPQSSGSTKASIEALEKK